jgi:hypothetical protein
MRSVKVSAVDNSAMKKASEGLLREIYTMVGGEKSGVTLDEARKLMLAANGSPSETTKHAYIRRN